jgi:hypothetical protein
MIFVHDEMMVMRDIKPGGNAESMLSLATSRLGTWEAETESLLLLVQRSRSGAPKSVRRAGYQQAYN